MTLTIQQAAKELGISEYMADKLAKDGVLRIVKLGKLIRIPRIALDELMRGEKPNS
jgi:excisionase family DNA binding protein